MMKKLSMIVYVLAIAIAAHAQSPVPTPDEFLGYQLGERFTPYARILDYLHELEKRSPLITVQQFGETYEHRPLVLAVITSAKNRAQLDALRSNVVALSDPQSTSAARADEIVKSAPAVAWLGFGVHGNESSSAEAAMEVASTLLRDPSSSAMLENLIVVIDPLQNPDGRERYVQWFTRTRGAQPNANPEAFEHAEPWPGGRTNHYLIDMNRDWAWTSQRETQARVAEYRRWNPQVFVDFHEMGSNSTYFFPPDATPLNANLPKDVQKWLDVFGRANAEAFTRRGWPFFVAERFDLFYPGYGDSWPALHGAIGMTYEVAGGGRGGSVVDREDGAKLTLAHRIEEHYTTAMATLRTASEHREELLRYTYDAMRAQLAAGGNTFLLLPGSPNFEPLLDMLARQKVQIGRLTNSASLRATRIDSDAAETRVFPAGTAVISTKQPLGGLVQTLLEKSPTFTKGFLDEQRKKTSADEPDDFYDLTSWSLPLAMNVEGFVTTAPVVGAAAYEKPSPAAFRSAAYAYLLDGNDADIYRVAGRLLRDGVRFSVSDDTMQLPDRNFARGTLVILKGSNEVGVDAKLAAIGANFFPVESGWTGATSFGSERIHPIKDPKIALIGGSGVGSGSYGMLWHTFDVDTPIPHTTLDVNSLRNVDLSHYGVIVLPDGDYADKFGKNADRLKSWLRGGGTLIAIKGASNFLRDKDVDITKVKPWEPPKKKDDDKASPNSELYNQPRVPGATFRTAISQRSYLTFGVPRPPFVLIEGTAVYLPVTHAVDNVVTIGKESPVAAGVAWQESIDRLKGSAYLISEPFGRGQVITFADEPHFRLFWRGTLPLLMNAALYSPSFPRD
jgi:hypothetical protein